MLVLKQSFGGAGTFSILEKVQTVERLFPEKNFEIRKKIHFLPTEVINEMKEFTARNALFVFASCLEGKEPCHKCCEQCLKAHTLKKCKEMNLGTKIYTLLDEVFPCETGHDGHYVDNDTLLKIS